VHLQAVAIDDGTQKSMQERLEWSNLLRGLRTVLKDEVIVDWLQPKPNRVLLLCTAWVVYVALVPRAADDAISATAPGDCFRPLAKPSVRWAVQLRHISSIITVANTVVLLCTEPRQVGPVQLDVPVRRLLSCSQDAMVDLILHKVGHQVDQWCKHAEAATQPQDGHAGLGRADARVRGRLTCKALVGAQTSRVAH
jgi:hypothetical protein